MANKTALFKQKDLAGTAAVIAGTLYIARWIWELLEGILKNMHSPSLVTQNFFIVKLLFIIALAGIFIRIKGHKVARIGIVIVCTGILWTAVTRTIEAYGVSGPWGLFGSPGLLLFFLGLILTSSKLLKTLKFKYIGKMLIYIFLLSFIGSISAIFLFNMLGRDLAANQTASIISNIFLIAEGLVWINLGIQQMRSYKATRVGSAS